MAKKQHSSEGVSDLPSQSGFDVQTQAKLSAYLQQELSTINLTIKSLEKDLDKAKLAISKMGEKVKITEGNFTEKIEKVSKESTAVLAVFVALFTFVSIDFQLVRTAADVWTTAGLMLLMAVVLLLFVLVLKELLGVSASDRARPVAIYCAMIAMTTVGLFLLCIGKIDSEDINKNRELPQKQQVLHSVSSTQFSNEINVFNNVSSSSKEMIEGVVTSTINNDSIRNTTSSVR